MPSSGLVVHQVQRRVGDVDRAVEGLHAALVRLAVGQRHLLEHHVPAVAAASLKTLVLYISTLEPHW